MSTQLAVTNKKFYDGIQTRFVEILDEQTFSKEVSFALQHFQKNPALLKCNRNSVLQSVMNIAQVGLTLNPIKSEAYLIPRWTKNGIMCVLEPSYQGLSKLVIDTGSVTSISCYPVFKGDQFEVSLGTSPDIDHKPKFKTKVLTHVYAVAQLPDGKSIVEVMTIEDCHMIRGKSESYKAYIAKKVKSCVWIEWEQEMCRKCCIKRMIKYLPKSEKWDKIHEAVALDNTGYEPELKKSEKKKSVKISTDESSELLIHCKIVVDEHTDAKELKSKLSGYIREQKEAGMHAKDLTELRKYMNTKFVSLKKAHQTKPVDLP
ncbi:MAG: recombinase RecT [Thaumarchaeota archaeon]|nr:recombinase RecT [Nitrososphaerota archaeon]